MGHDAIDAIRERGLLAAFCRAKRFAQCALNKTIFGVNQCRLGRFSQLFLQALLLGIAYGDNFVVVRQLVNQAIDLLISL